MLEDQAVPARCRHKFGSYGTYIATYPAAVKPHTYHRGVVGRTCAGFL